AQLAKHYGVEIAVCPPRRAQRKGVVEAAVKYTTRSWWRTAQVATLGEAQRDLDGWCLRVADARQRPGGTVAQLGAAEPLRSLPELARLRGLDADSAPVISLERYAQLAKAANQ